MRFFVFYLPTRRSFFCTIQGSLKLAWEALADFLGWKTEMVKHDCKVVADVEASKSADRQK